MKQTTETPQTTSNDSSNGEIPAARSTETISRSLDDLHRIIAETTKRGVKAHPIQEATLFTGGSAEMSLLLSGVINTFLQFERFLSEEEPSQTTIKAKPRGGKRSLTPERAAELRAGVKAREQKTVLAREFGISRATLYRYAPVAKQTDTKQPR